MITLDLKDKVELKIQNCFYLKVFLSIRINFSKNIVLFFILFMEFIRWYL